VGFAVLAVVALFLFRRERREDPKVIPGPNPSAPNPAMAEQDPATLQNRISDGDPSSSKRRTTNPPQRGNYDGPPEVTYI